MAVDGDPLAGLDELPWSRLCHFYGRATSFPQLIRNLAGDDHATAEKQLLNQIEHQDSIIQATPFAVWFIVRMLKAGQVRDPDAVRSLLARVRIATQNRLVSFPPSTEPMDWPALLFEERLWPEFRSDDEDEMRWEEWSPAQEEWNSWVVLTDRYLAEVVD